MANDFLISYRQQAKKEISDDISAGRYLKPGLIVAIPLSFFLDEMKVLMKLEVEFCVEDVKPVGSTS